MQSIPRRLALNALAFAALYIPIFTSPCDKAIMEAPRGTNTNLSARHFR